MDGRWHRVAVEGDTAGKQSGSYKGFLDDGVPNGLIMNYRAGGVAEKWIATGHHLDPADLDRLKTESQARQAQQAEDRQAQQRDAAKRAFGLHANAAPAPADHPYLVRKGVPPLADLRVTGDNKLLLPLRDGAGALWNVQTIDADGTKRFLHQGRKSGLCATIDGDPKGPLLVAEGYATGATLHGATGLGVAVALDAGNLEAVATTLRQTMPGRGLVIAADDDHARPDNPGLTKAVAAARAVDARVIVPPFTAAERARGLTDWNDLAGARGPAATRAILATLGLGTRQDRARTMANTKVKPKAPALGL
ncbi:phage/plasmid primase-like uncharacterized protein [Roseospira visakhapatnamensis]|uniref:Phage/plasmid primase-like uncharacterized protein n=2 Tax=Roseospira visakhapatnamensis TaxID=390880 RepID=A0A7W6RGT6_9PROT|nr:phage/plasmid primase-like uncharacterized protein [Roseospira visakhapatnamensis]